MGEVAHGGRGKRREMGGGPPQSVAADKKCIGSPF